MILIQAADVARGTADAATDPKKEEEKGKGWSKGMRQCVVLD